MASETKKKANTKLQPKLRMIANGSTQVNVVRAEQCASIAVRREVSEGIPQVRGDRAAPMPRSKLARTSKRGSLTAPPDALAHVFVELVGAGEEAEPVPGQSGRIGNLVAATIPVAALDQLAERSYVAHIELGEPLSPPTPEVSTKLAAPPGRSTRRFGSPRDHRQGEGVLIGIIDVGGFDFSHPEFLDADGRTRFVRIWDQGAVDSRPPPQGTGVGKFIYGAELTDAHLNRAIQAAESEGLPAFELEPQSQMSIGSHGTHVASIAAGNHGLCPKAHIAGVLISVPAQEADRRRSFYDSTRIVHAIDYLIRLSQELAEQKGLSSPLPLSINISLGTNGHAHDSTSAVSRWIDSALTIRGRSVCVAAGNAGQEVAQFAGDQGYVMGRIHTAGRVPSRGLVTEFEWVVVGNGVADISENELELWYSPQDRFVISIKPPGGPWIGPVEPCQYIENQQLADGCYLSIYNELYHPATGGSYIAVFLSPHLSEQVVGVTAGSWVVRLHGLEVRDGHFHAWIERDDPRRQGRVGPKESWRFPSFFAEGSFVDKSTVSSLACGHSIISVANLDEATNRINKTSSQGPTRDNRFKPEVAAPGTEILGARGFDPDGELWIRMSGTSMASPFVTGVAGLMLAIEPTLTAAQISGMIQRTARPLPGADYAWLDDAGFGVIDPQACLKETKQINTRRDLTRK